MAIRRYYIAALTVIMLLVVGGAVFLGRGSAVAQSCTDLTFGTVVSGTLASPVEIHCYSFSGAVGDTVRLQMSRTSGGLDPTLEVLKDGILVTGCSDTTTGASLTFDCDIATSSTHTILASDGGADETGNYDLSLTCLTIPCSEQPNHKFTAGLSGTQEVPPVSTMTTGSARFEFSNDFSELSFQLKVIDGIAITQAHIHCGGRGEVGPIIAFLAGEIPSGVMVDGVWISSVTLTDANIMPGNGCGDSMQQLGDALNDSGAVYVNVHSVANPSGEIRGQLQVSNR